MGKDDECEVNHAKNLKGIAVLPSELDKHKMLLNLDNGTCNLVTCEVAPPEREHLITKLAPIKFDPEAKCPIWLEFLEKIMGGNATLINFLQKTVGYTLTGNITEQCMFILYGDGSNGKSTFTNTIAALLGEDYVKNTPTQTLMARKNEGIPNDVAALQGARMVIESEGEQGQRLAESQIKRMTGGDDIAARFMRGEFFSFTPEFKIYYFTNHKPQIRGTDEGIWRRIRLIPFTVKIHDNEKDPNLSEKLRAELSGILNWGLAGCLKWQEEGLGYPDEIRAATETFRAEMNVVGRFLEDRYERVTNSRVKYSDVYALFKLWCAEYGEYVIASNLFSQKLGELDLKSRRSDSGGATEIHGLKLIEIPDVVSEINRANATSAFVSIGGEVILSSGSVTSEGDDLSYDDF